MIKINLGSSANKCFEIVPSGTIIIIKPDRWAVKKAKFVKFFVHFFFTIPL
jgi:hypothetical protein